MIFLTNTNSASYTGWSRERLLQVMRGPKTWAHSPPGKLDSKRSASSDHDKDDINSDNEDSYHWSTLDGSFLPLSSSCSHANYQLCPSNCCFLDKLCRLPFCSTSSSSTSAVLQSWYLAVCVFPLFLLILLYLYLLKVRLPLCSTTFSRGFCCSAKSSSPRANFWICVFFFVFLHLPLYLVTCLWQRSGWLFAAL